MVKEPPPYVPKLRKKGIRIFSEIDLNTKLKLPRDLFGYLNEGGSDEVIIPELGG